MLGDELARAGHVAARDRVADGGARRAGRPEPVRRPPVQRGDGLGPGARELVAEEPGEEMVVAVPLAAGVEREHEQPAALERVEHRGGPLALGDPVAQRPAEAVEDRGREQELAHLGRLAVEDLEPEVVDDRPVVAGERRDEGPPVLAAGERQGGEPEPGGPALGAPVQARDVVGVEPERERVVEQRRRLGVGEAQVGGADLGELAADAQAPDRQRRLGPGGDRELQRRRPAVEEERHRLVHPRVGDHVVVVEDEDDPAILAPRGR